MSIILSLSLNDWQKYTARCFIIEQDAVMLILFNRGRDQLKCDGTRAETKFRLSAKRTSPFKSAGESVQSTTDSRGVRISGSNAGYTMFRSSVKGTGYPLHSPISPSLPLLCVGVCHHISTGLYVPETLTILLRHAPYRYFVWYHNFYRIELLLLTF